MSSSGNWDFGTKAVEDTCEEYVPGLSTHPFLAILSLEVKKAIEGILSRWRPVIGFGLYLEGQGIDCPL